MQAIQAIRELTGNRGRNGGEATERSPRTANSFRQARFHRIGPPPDDLLGTGASGDRSPRNLQALWEAGRSDARRFLMRDGKQIGLKETLDLKAAFIDERKTRLPARPTGSRRRSQAADRVQPVDARPEPSIASPSAFSIGGS